MKSAILLAAISFALNGFCCENGEFYAINPYKMQCYGFANSCEVPADWMRVNSCDIASHANGMTPPSDMDAVVKKMSRLKDQARAGGSLRIEELQGLVNGGAATPSQVTGGMSFYLQSE